MSGVLAGLIGAFSPSPSSYESIATLSGSGVSSVTFSSIPSTYKHLQIRSLVRHASDGGTGVAGLKMRFNGDSTTSGYRSHYVEGRNSVVTASTNSDTAGFIYNAFARSAATTNSFAVGVIDIVDYASTSKLKTVRAIAGADFNNTNSGIALSSFLYTVNTNAISSITIFPELTGNFASGTSFALYGIKG